MARRWIHTKMLLPYLAVLCFSVGMIAIAQGKANVIGLPCYFVVFVVLVLFSGMRSCSVGTDAVVYAYEFAAQTTSLQDVGDLNSEPAFSVVCVLGNQFTRNYIGTFLIIAMAVCGCYLYGIGRHSVYPAISVFIFIAAGFYTAHFNLARQGVAIAIVFLATRAALDRNFMKYFLLVALASLFHRTALCMIPAYFLLTRKNTILNGLVILLLGAVAALSLDALFSVAGMIDDRYEDYGEYAGGAVGWALTLTLLAATAFFVYFKPRVRVCRDEYDLLLNMLIIASTIAVVSALAGVYGSGPRRLASYFSIALILIWPIVFANISDIRERILFGAIVGVCYSAYFCVTTMVYLDLVPYKLNSIVLGSM